MKVSLKWLRDYCDIVLSPEELAGRLTLSGTKVEGIERIGTGWDDILTAEIVRLEPHPNADRLQLCTVDLGDRRQTVLTGAFNIAVGDRVPFIGVGGTLPNGTVMEPRKMRGIVSEGMVLAQDELGIGDDHAGIYILDPQTPPGLPIADVLGDVVLDLEITPNRPDCLSMIGVAREVAALTGQELRLPAVRLDEHEPAVTALASVRVEDPDLCPRYTARVVSGITVGPSPAWLATRLSAAGMRPINNIVDISNYVMLEWGQPLHTFDLQAVQDSAIIVRRARPGETLETLDGQVRELEPDMLVIADPRHAVGVAGVMGAANSEITAETHTVLIESANFAPRSIRHTAQILGLRSEASSRFEKGLPWTLPPLALDRAAALIAEFGGASPDHPLGGSADVSMNEARGRRGSGVVHRGMIDAPPRTAGRAGEGEVAAPPPQVVIDLPEDEVTRLLGVSFTREQIVASLQPLGFSVSPGAAAGHLSVAVPSWRADVQEAADLVEEVARMLGFDNVPTTMPRGIVSAPPLTPVQIWDERIRLFLLAAGLTDLATYSLISASSLSVLFSLQDASGAGGELTTQRLALLVPNPEGVRNHGAGFGLMRLTNPLTPEQELLRPSLLPGLIATLRTNLRHTVEDLAFFEFARCFFPRPGDLPYERLTLGIALAGLREARSWLQPAIDASLLSHSKHGTHDAAHAEGTANASRGNSHSLQEQPSLLREGRAEPEPPAQHSPAGSEREMNFFDLKGLLEELLDHCGVRGYAVVRTEHHPILHPGRAARLLAPDRRELGYFGEIHPALAPHLDLGDRRAYVAELDADLLISLSSADRQAQPISRFPVVKRDIAVVVPDAVDAASLVQAIAAAGGDLLHEVRVFDVYRGEPVPAGHKSVACALTLQAPDRTLGDREAGEVFDRVARRLSDTFGGQVRDAAAQS